MTEALPRETAVVKAHARYSRRFKARASPTHSYPPETTQPRFSYNACHRFNGGNLHRKVEVKFCNIRDLAPLLPLLAKFRNLRVLELAGNALAVLPSDLSGLRNVEKLGIKHNNFATGSLGLILNALKSMPNLVNLEIVIEEKDEEAVLSALPNLQVLNKIQLSEDGLGNGSGSSSALA